MVAIFQSQKRSVQADIDEHREFLSTLQVRLLSVFQVLCVATPTPSAETHIEMLAMQLLDFLSVIRVNKRHPRTAAAAARNPYRVKSSWSAVLPVRSGLNTVVPESCDTVRAALNLEHFLRLLTTIQAQGVFADTCSALSSPPGDPAPCVVSAQRQLAAESKNEVQHKLSRWPWSVVGKQVGFHGSVSHTWYPGTWIMR
jgi:hypothetical protein